MPSYSITPALWRRHTACSWTQGEAPWRAQRSKHVSMFLDQLIDPMVNTLQYEMYRNVSNTFHSFHYLQDTSERNWKDIWKVVKCCKYVVICCNDSIEAWRYKFDPIQSWNSISFDRHTHLAQKHTGWCQACSHLLQCLANSDVNCLQSSYINSLYPRMRIDTMLCIWLVLPDSKKRRNSAGFSRLLIAFRLHGFHILHLCRSFGVHLSFLCPIL